jgi:magnesium chelatase subunit I
VGHRGDLVMMRAARADAALEGVPVIERRHLRQVAKLALIHRRPNAESGSIRAWTEEDEALVDRVLFARGDR